MPKQITTRGPLQVRQFTPLAEGHEGYVERDQVVSRVRVIERGPDVQLQVYSREVLAGNLTVLAADEPELLARLFGEAPLATTVDREILGRVLDAHEEACMAGNTLRVTETRRIVWTYLTALITDHHELARLKDGERGAA